MNGKRPQSKVFVGTVVRRVENKLTIRIRDGKNRTYSVADDAEIIGDGAASTLDEIQAGQHIRVTTRKKDFSIVVVIESLRDNADFPSLTGARK